MKITIKKTNIYQMKIIFKYRLLILPMEITMRAPGTPNANEKHVSSPKQWTSSRRIGVMVVDSNEPALMAM